MKLWQQPWTRSFRLRLALAFVLAVAGLLAAYGSAVAWKLERVSSERVEHRLRTVAARWVPDALRGMDPVRLEGAGDENSRGVRLATLRTDGASGTRIGDWPEGLRVRWEEWIRAEGFSLVSLLPPEPVQAGEAPVLGRRTVLSEPLPPRELAKLVSREWQVDGTTWAMVCGRMNNLFVGLAYDLTGEAETARSLARAQLRYFLIAMVPVGLLAWIFATRALRPVRRLAATMREVTGENLDARLPEESAAAEFRDLIAVYNAMILRLSRSFQQTARFSSDAAHELKTPLAVLQGELVEALEAEEAGSARQQRFSSMLEEVQRLKGITDRLLLLARADAGSLVRQRTVVELRPILEEMLEDLTVTSPGLTLSSALQRVGVAGDPVLLRQGLFNLLANAAKYNRPDGWITVRLFESSGGRRREVRLEVENAGEPIPEAAQAHLFERFFRADTARSRLIDGFGLGLSLTREIARAHEGELDLVRSDARGTLFRLSLPAVALESSGA
jgi:two-component system, OmpR family, heavy metal sensor histidine kinase CusS